MTMTTENRSTSRNSAADALLDNKDLYCLLLDIQNGITAPGHASMANGVLLKIDAARKARRCAGSEIPSLNAAPSGEFTNRKPVANGEGPGAAAPGDKNDHEITDREAYARFWMEQYERHTSEAAEAKRQAERFGATFTPSADVCSACGAKEGEPCRGNCERRMPSHVLRSETPVEWHEREKVAFEAWWQARADGYGKSYDVTAEPAVLAAGAAWFARAQQCTPSATGTVGWQPSVPHNDHPLRHFDRTCQACIEEGRDDGAAAP
jgi:hypothetical protein